MHDFAKLAAELREMNERINEIRSRMDDYFRDSNLRIALGRREEFIHREADAILAALDLAAKVGKTIAARKEWLRSDTPSPEKVARLSELRLLAYEWGVDIDFRDVLASPHPSELLPLVDAMKTASDLEQENRDAE